MNWTSDKQLLLFDFDGLLVDTERTHYKAYQELFSRYGVSLEWDFPRYCQTAHYSANGLRESAEERFPDLVASKGWDNLYKEKKQIFLSLLEGGNVALMPGVKEMLSTLSQSNATTCVVTHSAKELINKIRTILPELNEIQHWITREHYTEPKPAPDSYLTALKMFAKEGDKVIGFEDTVRGMRAMLFAFKQVPFKVQSEAVVVAEAAKPAGIDELVAEVGHPVQYYKSFHG